MFAFFDAFPPTCAVTDTRFESSVIVSWASIAVLDASHAGFCLGEDLTANHRDIR